MDIFRFKQFEVDQTGCAMKVNTDGVLLGAMAEVNDPKSILDIGTGTGVIALMLAQRYPSATIDAVEVDGDAARMSAENFKNSQFSNRLSAHHCSFENYFEVHEGLKFDLIVSNPPFFLSSLTSANNKKNLARHTDSAFFERLLKDLAKHLTERGTSQLILPLPTSELIRGLLPKFKLHLHKIIAIKSFTDSEPHREIITFGKEEKQLQIQELFIYDEPKVYAKDYQLLLKDFLTIF
ncbi:MAG: methyltransferase [Bacteroidota bacterium]